MAAACGVNALLVPTAATAAMTQVRALSPDGRCKAFGAEADGYGRGEGYAAVVMEPAASVPSAAPLALFAGSAVNQDGRSSGLTAPHGPSQTALVGAAMREARLPALDYAATHGTGVFACPEAAPGVCCARGFCCDAVSGSCHYRRSCPSVAAMCVHTPECTAFWPIHAGTPLGDPIETGALRKAVAPPAAQGEPMAPVLRIIQRAALGLGLRTTCRAWQNSGCADTPAGAAFTAGAIKALTGHLEGTAGLAGLLLGQVALAQRFAHGMRYRWAAVV